MARKPRALNKGERYKKEIIELSNQGMKPAEIFRHFEGKLTYWQIYNTIKPRDLANTKIDVDGNLVENKKADSLVSSLPESDLSSFSSTEEYVEHQIAAILGQLQEKKLSLKERVFLLRELSKINKMNKSLQMENYLKNPKAKLIINIMRRLDPTLSDADIIRIYKEEVEKLKNEAR